MASKTFLLLALAFAVVVVITSQIVAAKEVAFNHDSEVDGRGGYNAAPHGEYNGRRRYGCKYVCCGRGRHGGCKCCSTFAEATAYKQTNN